MNYKNDEINEQTIPPCYNNRVRYNRSVRSATCTKQMQKRNRLGILLSRRQKRELILTIIGATVIGLLIAHMGYILAFMFDAMGVI